MALRKAREQVADEKRLNFLCCKFKMRIGMSRPVFFVHVSSDSVVLSGISFDELCKLRENWTLGNAVPVMTSASKLFGEGKKKAGFPSPLIALNVNSCILLLVLINFQPCLFQAFIALEMN